MADESVPFPIMRRKDALALGLIRHFTGKPCKHGHLSERWAKDGKCVECTRLFQTEQRELYRARHKLWRDANPDKLKAIVRRAYVKNRVSKLAYCREWQRRNPDKVKAAARRHYAKHAERYRAATKAWRAAHLEYAREACRLWGKANPAAAKANSQKRRARKRAAEGSFTGAQINDLVLRQKRRCANCRERLGKVWHIDHVKALSRGGDNSIRNIQILCPTCNCRKHAKDPIDFAREQGRLL